jgi:hypothetical protein
LVVLSKSVRAPTVIGLEYFNTHVHSGNTGCYVIRPAAQESKMCFGPCGQGVAPCDELRVASRKLPTPVHAFLTARREKRHLLRMFVLEIV